MHAKQKRIIFYVLIAFMIFCILIITVFGFLKLLADRLVFVNDTGEEMEFVVFLYDNYEYTTGKVSRSYSLKEGREKVLLDSYPECIHFQNTGQSYKLETTAGEKQKKFYFSEIMTSQENCPLTIKEWREDDRWRCPASKSGYEACRLLNG